MSFPSEQITSAENADFAEKVKRIEALLLDARLYATGSAERFAMESYNNGISSALEILLAPPAERPDC